MKEKIVRTVTEGPGGSIQELLHNEMRKTHSELMKDIDKMENVMATVFHQKFADIMAEICSEASIIISRNKKKTDQLLSIYRSWSQLVDEYMKLYLELPVNIFDTKDLNVQLTQVKIGTMLFMEFCEYSSCKIEKRLPKISTTFHRQIQHLMEEHHPREAKILDYDWDTDRGYSWVTECLPGKNENIYMVMAFMVEIAIISNQDKYQKSEDASGIRELFLFLTMQICGVIDRWELFSKVVNQEYMYQKEDPLYPCLKVKTRNGLLHIVSEVEEEENRGIQMAMERVMGDYEEVPYLIFDPLLFSTAVSQKYGIATDETFTKKECKNIRNMIIGCCHSLGSNTVESYGADGKMLQVSQSIVIAFEMYLLARKAKEGKVAAILFALRNEKSRTSMKTDTSLIRDLDKANQMIEELSSKVADLQAKLNEQQEKKLRTFNTEQSRERRIEILEQEKKDLQEENRNLQEQLEILKELAKSGELVEEEIGEETARSMEKEEENLTGEEAEEIIRSYARSHSLFLIGGNPNLVKRIENKYPDIHYYHTRRTGDFDRMMAGADLILFKSDCLAHSAYNKAKTTAIQNNVPYGYVRTLTSVPMLEKDIALLIKKLG